jgi:hypothetical protein
MLFWSVLTAFIGFTNPGISLGHHYLVDSGILPAGACYFAQAFAIHSRHLSRAVAYRWLRHLADQSIVILFRSLPLSGSSFSASLSREAAKYRLWHPCQPVHKILLGLLQLAASPFSESALGSSISLGTRRIVDCGILPTGASYFASTSAVVGLSIAGNFLGHQYTFYCGIL